VAEELQLKGLMGSGAEKEADGSTHKTPQNKKTQKLSQERNYSSQKEIPPSLVDKPSYVAKVETFPDLEGTVAITEYTVAADLHDLDDKIKSMMESTEKTIFATDKYRKVMKCKVCGKEGKLSNIKSHIESNHITGISHTCNICGKTSRSRHGLIQHMLKNHRTI